MEFVTSGNIAAFILGLIGASIIEWNKRRGETRDRLIYFHNQITKALEQSDEQQKFYYEYADSLSNDPMGDHVLTVKLNPELENLLVPDQGFLFNAFRKKFKHIDDPLGKYQRVFRQLKFIQLHNEMSREMYRTYKNEFLGLLNGVSDLRRDLITLILRAYNSMSVKPNRSTAPFIEFLQDLMDGYKTDQPKPMTVDHIFNTLAKPIIETFSRNFRNIPEAEGMIEIAAEIRDKKLSMIGTSESFSGGFRKYGNDLQNAIEAIRKEITGMDFPQHR